MQHTWERARWGRGTCGRGSPGPRKPATDPRGLPSPPAPQGRGARKRPLLARRAGPAPPRPSQLGRAAPPLALTDGWEQRCRFWAEPEESRWDSYVLLSPPWQLGSLCNMAEPRKAAARPSRGRRTATWRATRHTAASALGEAAEIWGLSLRPARGLHRWGGVGGLAMSSALPPGPCAGRGAHPPLPGPPRVAHCVTPDKPLGPSDPHLPYLPSRVYMVVVGGQPLRCREGHGPLPVPLPGDTVHLCEHSCLLFQTQPPEGSRPTPPCLEQGFGAQRLSQREGAHVLAQITQGRPSWTCRPGAPCPGPALTRADP